MMALSIKRYKNLVAVRDPKTGLFWDGKTRSPEKFGFDHCFRLNNEYKQKYNRFSNLGWKPKWEKTPHICRSNDFLDSAVLRYKVDQKYFPFDCRGKPIPDIEIVVFDGYFDLKTRKLELTTAIEIRKYPPEINDIEFKAEEIRLCIGYSLSEAFIDAFIDNVEIANEYRYALRVPKKTEEIKERLLPFDFIYCKSILFLKDEVSLMLARTILGNQSKQFDLHNIPLPT